MSSFVIVRLFDMLYHESIITGVLKSMKQKFAREKKWEKGGKAKKQWTDEGVFVGRKQKQYVV